MGAIWVVCRVVFFMVCSSEIRIWRRPGTVKAATILVALVLSSLAAAGAAPKPRFTISNLTVKDRVTGLVWTRNGSPAGQMLSWHDAFRFVSMMNQRNYGGHSDWRLPEIDELRKLVAAAREVRTGEADKENSLATDLMRAGFDVEAGDYWSSTTSLFNNVEALYISMISGSESIGSKNLYMHVWPVRSEPKKKQHAGAAPRSASPGLSARDKAVRK